MNELLPLSMHILLLIFFKYIRIIYDLIFFVFITFRGSSDATKQAHTLIAALIKDPDVDILQMLPKSKLAVVTTSSWDKTISTVAVRLIKLLYQIIISNYYINI